MTLLGDFYYQTEYFPITNFLQPGMAYVRALECAEKHGDKMAGTGQGTVSRAYDDAGMIIGYNVKSRHYVGGPGSDHPDKPKDRDAGHS